MKEKAKEQEGGRTEGVQKFLRSLKSIIEKGREDSESYRETMTLWMYMGLGETNRNGKNLKSCGSNHMNLKRQKVLKSRISGHLVEDYLSTSHEAYILLSVENYLHKDGEGKLSFPAQGEEIRYTKRKQVGQDNSYSQESLHRYNALMHQVNNDRKATHEKFKDRDVGEDEEDDGEDDGEEGEDAEREERPDRFIFDEEDEDAEVVVMNETEVPDIVVFNETFTGADLDTSGGGEGSNLEIGDSELV